MIHEKVEREGNTIFFRLGHTTEDTELVKAKEQLKVLESEVYFHLRKKAALFGILKIDKSLKVDQYSYEEEIKKFPDYLSKLWFKNGKITQTILDAMAILPQLRVLKLQNCSFDTMVILPQLIVLILENCSFKDSTSNWFATEIHFPALKRLKIVQCPDLSEIHIGIAQIETLEIIKVENCEPSLVNSTRKIRDEKHRLGNILFQLYLDGEVDKFCPPQELVLSLENLGLDSKEQHSYSLDNSQRSLANRTSPRGQRARNWRLASDVDPVAHGEDNEASSSRDLGVAPGERTESEASSSGALRATDSSPKTVATGERMHESASGCSGDFVTSDQPITSSDTRNERCNSSPPIRTPNDLAQFTENLVLPEEDDEDEYVERPISPTRFYMLQNWALYIDNLVSKDEDECDDEFEDEYSYSSDSSQRSLQ